LREPSIHIKEKQLKKALKKILREELGAKDVDHKYLAKRLLEISKGKSCNNRNIVVSNEKLAKKSKVIISAQKADTLLLADIIFKVRKGKLKHKGVKKIDQNHPDWSKLKQLVTCCINFCNDNNLEKKKGFISYITMGLQKISSTRQYIHKLINMEESISNEYQFVLDIQNDENPTETRQIHDYYVSMINTNTGIAQPFTDNPSKYVKFIEVRKLTDELNIPFDIFIKAQFYGLAWADSFPEPGQLTGDKAMERLNKYMYKNKIKKETKKTKAENKLMAFKLNNHGKKGNKNRG
jgi:hypothetical protein